MERMRHRAGTVCDTLDFYAKKMTINDVVNAHGRRGVRVHPSSIYRWLKKFIAAIRRLARGLRAGVGDRFLVDEMFVDIGGKGHCLFMIMDYETRFILDWRVSDRKDGYNAAEMFREAERRAGKKPAELVSDCLPSYREAFKKVFEAKSPLDDDCTHVSDTGLGKAKNNNNVRERVNSTQRTCHRVRRGIKSAASPASPLFEIWHNFVRGHGTLKRTPAEAAGITIHGTDKWRTLLGNVCTESWRVA